MSSNITHVAVLGATGQTGSVIVKALLESKSPEFVRNPFPFYIVVTVLISTLESHESHETVLSSKASSHRAGKERGGDCGC